MVAATPYEAAVQAHHPVCYYPLNETSGTTAAELINGDNGTYEANATLGQAGVANPIPGLPRQ